jgi:hypothetical protein
MIYSLQIGGDAFSFELTNPGPGRAAGLREGVPYDGPGLERHQRGGKRHQPRQLEGS